MKQVYADLINGFHIKVKPIRADVFAYPLGETPCVLCEVQDNAHGYRKGETVQFGYNRLFCIAGYSSISGKTKAVDPDFSNLAPRI